MAEPVPNSSKSEPTAAPAPAAPPASIEERLKKLRPGQILSLPKEERRELLEKGTEISLAKRLRIGEAQIKQADALKKARAKTAEGKRLASVAAKAVQAGNTETEEQIRTKALGGQLSSSRLPVFLKRVADRRGIVLNTETGTALIEDILKGATRPLTEGYDPSIPIYNPEKRGFDTDALQVANIWSMQNLGKQYSSPQELRENLPEAYGKLVSDQQKLLELHGQLMEEGGTELIGVLGDETVSAGRTTNEDLNTQLARQLPHGAQHTLMLADIDKDTLDLMHDAVHNPLSKEEMTAAGIHPSQQKEVVKLSRMVDPARPSAVIMPLTQSVDGTTLVHLGIMYDMVYGARHRAIRRQEPDLPNEEVIRRAQDEANKHIQRALNTKAPYYHPDPERIFSEFLKGEGVRGNAVDTANVLGSIMTLGLDEAAGDWLDKYQRTQMALTLPPIRVAGTLKEATDESVRAGQFGFFSATEYLPDSKVTRFVDQAFRLNAMSEGASAAWAMGLEDVVEEHGSFAGRGDEILAKAAEYYGEPAHLFRVASRDDDIGTMMFTVGRAFDPTVMLGMREVPEELGYWDTLTTVTGGLALIAAMFFEPDALTMFGPTVKGARAASQAAALVAGVDKALAGAGAARKAVSYNNRTGLEGLEEILSDSRAGTLTPEDTAILLNEQALADPLGRHATTTRTAEMQTLLELERGMPAVGRDPSVMSQVVATEKELERAHEAEKAALDQKIQNFTAAPADKEALARAGNHWVDMKEQAKAADGTRRIEAARLRDIRARQQVLNNVQTTGSGVTDAVRQNLAEELKGLGKMNDAQRIHFLQNNHVQEVLKASGLDPIEVLGQAQALARTGARSGINPAEWKKFYSNLKGSLLTSLARPISDAVTATRQALVAQEAEAVRHLQKADAIKQRARAAKAAAQTTFLQRAQAAGVTGAPQAIASAEAALLKKYRKHDENVERIQQVQDQILQYQQSPKYYVERTLEHMIELIKVSDAMEKAAPIVRQRLSGVLKDVRRVGEITPEIRKKAEGVFKQDTTLDQMLDDMRRQAASPAEYEEAVGQLLKNQLHMRELYLKPGGVASMVRNQPGKKALMGWMKRTMVRGIHYTLRGRHELDELNRFLSVEVGVQDLKINRELKDAGNAQAIYARSVNDELQEFILYSDKIAGEERFDRLKRLTFEFLGGTGVVNMRTTIGQEERLVSRAGSVAPLDEAFDYLRDVVRAETSGLDVSDAVMTTMVKAFARDRIAAHEVGKATLKAQQNASNSLAKFFDSNPTTQAIFEELPEILRKSWEPTHRGPPKSQKDHELLYQTLVLAAAEGRMLKRVAGMSFAQRYLFSPSLARCLNSFLDEGLEAQPVGADALKVGDIVVSTRSVEKFNAVMNKPVAAPKASPKRVGDISTQTDQPVSVPARGLPTDPRVADKNLEQAKAAKRRSEQKRPDLQGKARDYYLEKKLRRAGQLEGLRIIDRFEENGVPMVRLQDLSGEYAGIRKAEEVTLRDPLHGFNDAVDAMLALGLSVTAGSSKAEKIKGAAASAKKEYSRLVARSLDAEGNILLTPRDMSKTVHNALEGLEKELTDVAMPVRIGRNMLRMAGNLSSIYKKAILFGYVIPRAAFATNASYGDTTQMIVDLNDVPLPRILKVSLAGTLGYLPGVGKAWQEGIDIGRRSGQLPSAVAGLTDNTTRAVLQGTDELIEVHRGGKVLYEKASDILAKALAEGSGDNILTPDSMRALRRAPEESILKGMTRDYVRSLEIHMREATRAQRTLLFLELYANQGMDAQKAGLRMRQALYNWDSAAGEFEMTWLANNVLFYQFMKNAFAQAHRTIFEGYTDSLNDYIGKFMRGRTKMQRLEVLSTVSGGFLPGVTEAVDTVTPEEAEQRIHTAAMPDYLAEQTLLATQPLSRDAQRIGKTLVGRAYDSKAGVLPKITHVEFLNNYLGLANTILGTAGVSVLNGMGLIETEADFQAAGEGLLRYVVDLSHPVSGEAIRGMAEGMLGIGDPLRKTVGGKKVRMGEAAMLTHFGMEDALELQDDGTLRINPDSTTGLIGRLYGTTGFTEMARIFALPEYTRARLWDEVITGGRLSAGSVKLAKVLFKGIPFFDNIDELGEARIEAGPLDVVLTRAEEGAVKARIIAFTNSLGAYGNKFYEGKATREYRIKDTKTELTEAKGQAKKRALPDPRVERFTAPEP